MRVSVVLGNLMLWHDLTARIRLDFSGQRIAKKSRIHLMVALLLDSCWEFHDSFVRSETAGLLVFTANAMSEGLSVKRLPGTNHTGSHDYV